MSFLLGNLREISQCFWWQANQTAYSRNVFLRKIKIKKFVLCNAPQLIKLIWITVSKINIQALEKATINSTQ